MTNREKVIDIINSMSNWEVHIYQDNFIMYVDIAEMVDKGVQLSPRQKKRFDEIMSFYEVSKVKDDHQMETEYDDRVC